MSLLFKPGVRVGRMRLPISLALIVAKDVLEEHGYDLIVTSIDDSGHSEFSDHYKGYGLDFRSKHIKTTPEKVDIHEEIVERLMALGEFRVLLEDMDQPNEHYHVGYKPRRAK